MSWLISLTPQTVQCYASTLRFEADLGHRLGSYSLHPHSARAPSFFSISLSFLSTSFPPAAARSAPLKSSIITKRARPPPQSPCSSSPRLARLAPPRACPARHSDRPRPPRPPRGSCRGSRPTRVPRRDAAAALRSRAGVALLLVLTLSIENHLLLRVCARQELSIADFPHIHTHIASTAPPKPPHRHPVSRRPPLGVKSRACATRLYLQVLH
ncbi:hypothetical protein B0H16DRAFT_933701 [Mycena metata]|uniref:Uncharacterized protein n=1 Tax=Mycena metata TaxID=1033252 RepID=A0AAD7N5Q1_9AGAR|nr:hypothetical protein B0H16DRAFT_933701 [Mycena metata]